MWYYKEEIVNGESFCIYLMILLYSKCVGYVLANQMSNGNREAATNRAKATFDWRMSALYKLSKY